MFVDQADIDVFAGDGGRGCISFRREKYVPHGGPDGGDGGLGGSVYLLAVAGVDTLLDMVGRHHWHATRGEHGMGKKKAGADGEDLVIRVPPGTLVYDRHSGLLLADLKTPGDKVCVAAGGRGGRGNINFVNSVRQAPEYAEPGEEGQIRELHLELRLIADVGLIGQPNAGKSTLLSRLSAAKPKIADYPFTTLRPQLGIAELDAERRLVLADIPGLIAGASQGAGLGLDFLRHIERTRVIVHLLDMVPLDGTDPYESYLEIRKELEAYSPKLASKAEILVANKMDLTGASEGLANLRSAMPGRMIYAISGVAGSGLRPLLEALWQQVQIAPPSEPILDPVARLLPSSKPAEPLHLAFEDTPEDLPANKKPEEPVKVSKKKKALSAEDELAASDPALAAEIAAMKADDQRKGKYYGQANKKPRSPVAPTQSVEAPAAPAVKVAKAAGKTPAKAAAKAAVKAPAKAKAKAVTKAKTPTQAAKAPALKAKKSLKTLKAAPKAKTVAKTPAQTPPKAPAKRLGKNAARRAVAARTGQRIGTKNRGKQAKRKLS